MITVTIPVTVLIILGIVLSGVLAWLFVAYLLEPIIFRIVFRNSNPPPNLVPEKFHKYLNHTESVREQLLTIHEQSGATWDSIAQELNIPETVLQTILITGKTPTQFTTPIFNYYTKTINKTPTH